jgi:WD40 repeat protein
LMFPDSIETWKIPGGTSIIEFSPNGEMLATRSGELTDRLIPRLVYKRLETTTKRAFDLRFTPDGKLLACRTDVRNEGIPVYRVEDGKLLHLFSSRIQPFLDKESLTNFALSPDGRYLAASYDVKMSDGFLFGGVASYRLTSHGRIRVWQLDKQS